MKLSVLSLGGSIIVPEGVDSEFLSEFVKSIRSYLENNPDDRLIFVCGGGAPARNYQKAYREAVGNESLVSADAQDWLGIRATHLNGELVRALFGNLAPDALVVNPTSEEVKFTGRVLVAGGWKPGFSTDTDAVYLAKRFGADTVINLSNIKKVYTDDPRKNPDAKPIDEITWSDFRKIVGDEWVPGKNVPFDPVASRLAQESHIRVVCADGRNITNTVSILTGGKFDGTVIG